MLKLYIGNKNYSSWSMRPWVLLRQAGIAFEEIVVRFDSFDEGSDFRKLISAVSPVGKVPVLDDDGFKVWDSLAIAEYLAERFPEKNFWPHGIRERARARSVCAEMHNGFAALRSVCPMNIEASLPHIGQLAWRDKPAVRADVARLVGMWRELLAAHAGPMLMGEFSIADAFFAPVCMRLKGYGLPVPGDIAAYIDRVCALPGVTAWTDGALAENDFREFEEPHRLRPA